MFLTSCWFSGDGSWYHIFWHTFTVAFDIHHVFPTLTFANPSKLNGFGVLWASFPETSQKIPTNSKLPKISNPASCICKVENSSWSSKSNLKIIWPMLRRILKHQKSMGSKNVCVSHWLHPWKKLLLASLGGFLDLKKTWIFSFSFGR